LVGLPALLFGRRWWQARRTSRFSRKLEQYAGIAERLRTSSPDEFAKAFSLLAALPDPELREATLDMAREVETHPHPELLTAAYDDLGITDRYRGILEQSPSWENRAMAAERLGRIGSTRAVPTLLRVLRDVKDEDEDVRGAALRALGRVRDVRALPDLIEALGYPEAALPPRIAEIILLFGEPAVSPLITELRKPESDVRRTWAAEILGWLADERAALPLMESLGDLSSEVRARAAGALGKIGDARAVDRLLEVLLGDPIPFVRTRAAQALGAIGEPRVIDHLIHVLKDPEWWVRIRAVEALEQIGPDASRALIAALEDEDAEVRRRAATALERMGYVEEAVDALAREGFRADVHKVLTLVGKAGVTGVIFGSLQRTEGRAQNLLVRLVGDIGNPLAGPSLRDLLATSRDPSLRSRIVEALAKTQCRGALPEIVACLRDDSEWVRHASVEALSTLGPEEYADQLFEQLRDPSPATRQAVCEVLSRLEDERSGAAVLNLLEDPSAEVRAAALRSIRRMEMSNIQGSVAPLLFDIAEEVQVEAALALSAVGGSESVRPILHAATGASDRLVDALVSAITRCHQGAFQDLLALVPADLHEGQILVLLEASHSAGSGSLEWIAQHVENPNPRVRRRAVLALRGFPEDEVHRLLERPLRDPNQAVRAAAVTVAGVLGGEGPCREAARLAADPQPAVRLNVALALGLSRLVALRESLFELARDAQPSVRAAAAVALALQNDINLLPVLKNYSRDADLCAAAREIFVPGSPDLLVRRALEEASSQGLLEARLFLGESPFALEKEMAQRAREALVEEERVRALEICGAIATGQSYTAALSILKNDPSPRVRDRALELLVKIRRDPEVAGVVSEVLTDPHPALRKKAAEILGGMACPEAVGALVRALDTTDRDLREALTTSLSAQVKRDPKHAEQLLREIPSTKTRKLGLIWLLGKSRTGGAMKALLRYLKDEDGDLRAASVGALGKYRLGIVAKHLRDSLSDPNPRVRAAVVNALSRARRPEYEVAMEKALSDPDAFVRQRAAVALLRMGAGCAVRRVRALSDEPKELQPIWAAGGVLLGVCSPSEIREHFGAKEFLSELLPLEEAEVAIRESPDPQRRLTAFRVLQVLSRERAGRVKGLLGGDPDPEVRKEADRFFAGSEAA
jgi:HEAT repeat protein